MSNTKKEWWYELSDAVVYEKFQDANLITSILHKKRVFIILEK